MLKVGQHWGFVARRTKRIVDLWIVVESIEGDEAKCFVVNGGYYFTCSASAPDLLKCAEGENEWRIVPVIQAKPPMSQANYNEGIAWLEEQTKKAS